MKTFACALRTLSLLLFLLSGSSVFSNTIHVPVDQQTIQAAVTAAANGDTVLVAPGTYTGPGNKNIELLGKAIVVMSSGGAAVTVIDCQGSGRGFYIHQNEGQGTRIIGFTIRNGPDIGGILCDNSTAPLISNCIVENCNNRGIYLGSSSKGVIEYCIVRNCLGGIYVSNNSEQAVIRNCLVTGKAISIAPAILPVKPFLTNSQKIARGRMIFLSPNTIHTVICFGLNKPVAPERGRNWKVRTIFPLTRETHW